MDNSTIPGLALAHYTFEMSTVSRIFEQCKGGEAFARKQKLLSKSKRDVLLSSRFAVVLGEVAFDDV